MPTQVVFNPKGDEVLRHMGYFPPAEFHQALRRERPALMQELLARLAEHAAAAPPLVTLLLVFLGGVISSASPCVLAAVPLVVATVGGTATSRSRAVLLSVSFVLGLALCFTALGAVAALTGRLIGDIGPWWKVVLGVVLVVMGLHLAGLVRLPLPAVDGTRFRGAGLAGAFGLGALTGTLSSPCATPILVVRAVARGVREEGAVGDGVARSVLARARRAAVRGRRRQRFRGGVPGEPGCRLGAAPPPGPGRADGGARRLGARADGDRCAHEVSA